MLIINSVSHLIKPEMKSFGINDKVAPRKQKTVTIEDIAHSPSRTGL